VQKESYGNEMSLLGILDIFIFTETAELEVGIGR
jgi:hypothetical protein